MELVKIRKKFQITLPLSIRGKLALEEGDFMTAEVRGDEIVLHPKKLIDKSQAWFWSEAWQAAEREAEADIQAGRVHGFSNAEGAVSFLHRRAAEESEES